MMKEEQVLNMASRPILNSRENTLLKYVFKEIHGHWSENLDIPRDVVVRH